MNFVINVVGVERIVEFVFAILMSYCTYKFGAAKVGSLLATALKVIEWSKEKSPEIVEVLEGEINKLGTSKKKILDKSLESLGIADVNRTLKDLVNQYGAAIYNRYGLRAPGSSKARTEGKAFDKLKKAYITGLIGAVPTIMKKGN